MYEYRAIVSKVYDGDTITVDIDLGFNAWQKNMKLRFYGINAPEVRGSERPQGLKARDWLRDKILGKQVILRTHRDRKCKYGRWLAEVYLPGENFEASINAQLVDAGLAEWKVYS
jgi:micrococcal nuclease